MPPLHTQTFSDAPKSAREAHQKNKKQHCSSSRRRKKILETRPQPLTWGLVQDPPTAGRRTAFLDRRTHYEREYFRRVCVEPRCTATRQRVERERERGSKREIKRRRRGSGEKGGTIEVCCCCCSSAGVANNSITRRASEPF